MEKVLILIMFSGEQEYESCLQSVKSQKFGQIDFEVISGLSNQEAHNKLYSLIMERSADHDYFIKLDADMVFVSENSVGEIIEIFKSHKDINHICLSVFDWFSNSEIMGLHAFSKDVKWNLPVSGLFLDPDPINSIRKNLKFKFPAPIAYHANNPTNFQAFYFGMHRMLKLLRQGESRLNFKTSLGHFNVLFKLWRKFLRTGDKRLGYALLGARCAVNQSLGELSSNKKTYENYFQNYESLNRREISALVESMLPTSRIGWVLYYLKIVGIRRLIVSLIKSFLSKFSKRARV